MGKRTGFLEYERKLTRERDPHGRIRDFDEIHEDFPEELLREQAARCMDCGIPFCHSGVTLGSMASGCPLNNLIPEWNDLLYRGHWAPAAERLLFTDNFPEFTGRVCPAPCEGACTCGIHQLPVTIRQNECAIIERAFADGLVAPRIPARRTAKRVAVVGSGPAGLAAADELNQMGHSVTVFERADRAGGLLMYGIPNMKLEKHIVERRLNLLEAEGIEFITGVEVGVDIPAQALRESYDALVLCCGAARARELNVEGREGDGVALAMEYLTASTRHVLGLEAALPQALDARGKDVIIIGGGDTGTDCLGTALRQGARNVRQFEIMPCPPAERAENNPWPEYPRVLKTDYAHEEAIALTGSDPRAYCVSTKRIDRGPDGRVRSVDTVDVQWEGNADGRMAPTELPGTERTWPAELVLLALGFLGPEQTLTAQLGLETDGRSNVKAERFSTSVPGVFAAGDMRRGQSLVVWAIAEGRAAARACGDYLRGE